MWNAPFIKTSLQGFYKRIKSVFGSIFTLTNGISNSGVTFLNALNYCIIFTNWNIWFRCRTFRNKKFIEKAEKYGYIKKSDNGYIPTILVFQGEKDRQIPADCKEHYAMLRRKVLDIATRHYLFCREQIYKEIPEFLKDSEFQIDHACANIFTLRGAVLEEALRQGYLSYDETDENRMLGAYLAL